MNTFSEIQAAFAKVLAEDCQSDEPAVQLMPEEQASLVAMLGKVLEAMPPLPTTTTKTKTGRKRARSAYQCWKSNADVKAAFREEHPGSDGPTTNKLMGQMWKALSAEEKAPFEAESAKEKEQFQSSAPATSPKTKATKGKRACGKPRKRARSAYQLYKMDESVRKTLREAMPDADFATFSKALSAQWKELSEEDAKPFHEAAAVEKAEFAANTSESESDEPSDTQAPSETQERTEAAQILRDLSSAETSSLTEESTTSASPKKKRGSSPYQQWKKHPATKAKFTSEHPEVEDKADMTRLLKSEWESMEGETAQEKLDTWLATQAQEEEEVQEA